MGCDLIDEYLLGDEEDSASAQIEKNSIEYLEKRYQEVKALNEKLAQKKDNIESTREQLLAKIDKFQQLIFEVKDTENFGNYAQAIANQEVKSHLKIIQVNLIYITKLEEVAVSLNKGASELRYLEEKFDSDVLVASVIGEAQISELIKQIDYVINKYLPYADELVLNTENINPVGLENIWNDTLFKMKLKEKEAAQKAKQQKIAKERKKARLRDIQEKERQLQIAEDLTKKQQQKYLRNPAGRLEKSLDNGRFSCDWYNRLDKKYTHYVKGKQVLKNKKYTIHISRIIKLKRYIIIELLWKYKKDGYAAFIKLGKVKLMDKNLFHHYPNNVFNSNGSRIDNDHVADIGGRSARVRSYEKTYHIYGGLDFEKIRKGNLLYGDNDTFLVEFTVPR
ncbi:hypothetical protein KAU09_02085 [Candidatus Parcubacteria bacterium]|nr:hypothetical protein [Candidatus Parcubacteria bacterium]